MKILITGSNGFLGQHLSLYLSQKQFRVIAASRGNNRLITENNFLYVSVDCTQENDVLNVVVKHQPNVIIHNAAMSKPNECHDNPAECVRQNILATQNLILAAKAVNSYFIYVSTDFVFGENGPNSENNVTGPLNVYGNSKLIAERLVETSGLSAAIMRPSFIYGPILAGMSPTFIHWIQQSLIEKKSIKVVNDQMRTPTYVYDICEGIYRMIHQKFEGTIHLAGKNVVTPYELACKVAEVAALDSSYIQKVTSETFVERVLRAKKSGLRIDKAIEVLKYNPIDFEEGIRLSLLRK